MPECPHCHREIEYLNVYYNVRGWESGTVSVSSIEDVIDWGDSENTDREFDYYACEHCGEVISESEAEELQNSVVSTAQPHSPQQRHATPCNEFPEESYSCRRCKYTFIKDEDEDTCPRCKKPLWKTGEKNS